MTDKLEKLRRVAIVCVVVALVLHVPARAAARRGDAAASDEAPPLGSDAEWSEAEAALFSVIDDVKNRTGWSRATELFVALRRNLRATPHRAAPLRTHSIIRDEGRARRPGEGGQRVPLVDTETFPKWARATPVVVTLRPGDMLYVPFHWWHWCFNYNQSATVNYWWDPGHEAGVVWPPDDQGRGDVEDDGDGVFDEGAPPVGEAFRRLREGFGDDALDLDAAGPQPPPVDELLKDPWKRVLARVRVYSCRSSEPGAAPGDCAGVDGEDPPAGRAQHPLAKPVRATRQARRRAAEKRGERGQATREMVLEYDQACQPGQRGCVRLDERTFLAAHVGLNRPAVMRQEAVGWPAVARRPGQGWDDRRRVGAASSGSRPRFCLGSRSWRVQSNDKSGLYGPPGVDATRVLPKGVESLADLHRWAAAHPHINAWCFLRLFEDGATSELEEDIDYPSFLAGIDVDKVNLWYSEADALTTGLHFDTYENVSQALVDCRAFVVASHRLLIPGVAQIMVQVRGEKRVVLVPPEQSGLLAMMPLPVRAAVSPAAPCRIAYTHYGIVPVASTFLIWRERMATSSTAHQASSRPRQMQRNCNPCDR